MLDAAKAAAAAAAPENKRLFVTIAALGSELPPLDRLRTIYPRYAETKASAGPDGLAILPFRAGTPYDGQDLVYFGTNPEQFFALCTRPGRIVPGTCIHERMLSAADIDVQVSARLVRRLAHDRRRFRPASHAVASAVKLAGPAAGKSHAIAGRSGQIHIQNRHFKNIGSWPLFIVDE